MIREPYSIEQRSVPPSYQHRYIMVVPLEWLDANPEYDWCRSADSTEMVDEGQRGENALHVLRTMWDRFEAQKRYRRDLR